MAEFTGSSSAANAELEKALTEAVRKAQTELASNMVFWRLKRIQGSVGGFTNMISIDVTIDADTSELQGD